MNKSGSGTITAHRKVGQSTTLNRKYVQRPGSKETREQITEEYRAEQLAKRQARAEAINRQNAERLANRQRTAQTITTRVHRATQVTTAPKL